jgi:predicted deacylase
VELALGRQVTGAPLSLPVLVLHGRHEGPTIWINAAIHGDEINGIEIIRRVLERLDVKTLRGTLVAIPIVNVPGFTTGDRYLPDRRDLNRSFPGSVRGSLAGRIANLLMRDVVSRCSVGIDLHTGSDHRTNLPQIRADLDDAHTLSLANAFGAPLMMHSSTRDGSLRQAATDAGATVLLFEAGEAWRFDESSIRTGVAGVLRVMAQLGMIDDDLDVPDIGGSPITTRRSRWARARRSGIALVWPTLGDVVSKGQKLGLIHNSFGERLAKITANTDGIVIGINLDPVVNQGDALIHIAEVSESSQGGEPRAAPENTAPENTQPDRPDSNNEVST